MGKSSLVSALTKDPGINAIDNAVMETPTGERIVVEGRDVHVVKIQVSALVLYHSNVPDPNTAHAQRQLRRGINTGRREV